MEQSEIARRTRRGLGLSAFSDIGHYLVVFGASIVLARLLGPADFGIISVVNGVLLLSFSVGTAGMGQAVVRARSLEKADLDVAFTMATGFSTLLMLAIMAGADPVARAVELPAVATVLPVLALRLLFAGAAAVPMGLLRRQMQFGRLAAVEIGVAVVYGVVGIGLATAGLGVWSLVWASLAEVSLRTLAVLIMSGYRPALRRAVGDQVRMLRFGGGLTASNFVQFAARAGPRMILASQLGADAAGLMNRADALSQKPVLRIFQVMQRVLFPAMSHLRTDTETFGQWHRRAAGAYALLVAPIVGIVGALAAELLAILLGPAWQDAALPLTLLCASSLAGLAFPFINLMLQARGRVDHLLLKTLILTPLLLVACFVGTRFGLAGFAAAGLVITPIQWVASALCLCVSLQLPILPVLAKTVPAIVAGLVGAVGARLAANSLGPLLPAGLAGEIALLGGAAIAGLAAFAVVVILFARDQLATLLKRPSNESLDAG